MKSIRSRLLTVVALTTSVGLTACAAPGSGTKAGGEDDGDTTVAAAAECSDVELRLSHQWPEPTGDEGGDFRALIAKKFADEVSTATDGQVSVTVYPNSTLAKATEQYDAMMSGSIDASVFPLDYASGKVPEWSITLMPALVRDHDEAKAWDEGEIGAAVRDNMEKNGLVALTNVWNAGAIGVKGDPILRPDDISGGETMRAAGTYVEHMLEAAGAGITSLPSSEIYTAMQTGVLDAAVTSTGSFASYNLQEQVKSYTSPTTHTFWFMYEPLVMTTSSFGKLCTEQQDAVLKVGEDLQDYAYTASREDDSRVEKIFQDAGVEVVTMSDEDFDAWLPLAQEQWDSFAESVDGGQELLDLAKKVREG
ncbi:TRAP transporter substrate-binding protein DctP [Ornithinimicrobium avium]|uniref:C4-dicarboxylate ABC transporter substrate-binding protein n=1 Tax=Ornithinimicrobium avium TaxID=2283195 RepID=A0A345NP81_9MICO|nr:TRAP transporter substrate-binding protein DctP [Ornithinimicrobium avium]AXH96839.1 C4-dicarboxylate ABC transporter substrate-binding protein [Ornithinimicrobium avium]